MKPSHSTGRNVIAILAIPIVMLFLIVATPFPLASPRPSIYAEWSTPARVPPRSPLSVAACSTKMEFPPEFGGQSYRCSERLMDASPISALNLRR